MKKVLSLILAALLTLALLTACGGPVSDRDGGIQIVTTIFPEYDWVMNILGSNPAGADVTMLLDTGVDLHSFQPTAKDILKISTCDLFIYVGGESDEWVDDALREAANQNRIVLNLLDTLGDAVKEEEVIEGMQEEEHDHYHDEDEEHEEEDHDGEETEYDEHVWLSLRNAAALVKSIAEALGKADPKNADIVIHAVPPLKSSAVTAVRSAGRRSMGRRFCLFLCRAGSSGRFGLIYFFLCRAHRLL